MIAPATSVAQTRAIHDTCDDAAGKPRLSRRAASTPRSSTGSGRRGDRRRSLNAAGRPSTVRRAPCQDSVVGDAKVGVRPAVHGVCGQAAGELGGHDPTGRREWSRDKGTNLDRGGVVGVEHHAASTAVKQMIVGSEEGPHVAKEWSPQSRELGPGGCRGDHGRWARRESNDGDRWRHRYMISTLQHAARRTGDGSGNTWSRRSRPSVRHTGSNALGIIA
jgi:hypothetical protein